MTGQQLAELINKQSAELELANKTLEVLRVGIEQQRQTVNQIQAKLDRLLPELKVRLHKCSNEPEDKGNIAHGFKVEDGRLNDWSDK